jgi:hypothetical protein
MHVGMHLKKITLFMCPAKRRFYTFHPGEKYMIAPAITLKNVYNIAFQINRVVISQVFPGQVTLKTPSDKKILGNFHLLLS